MVPNTTGNQYTKELCEAREATLNPTFFLKVQESSFHIKISNQNYKDQVPYKKKIRKRIRNRIASLQKMQSSQRHAHRLGQNLFKISSKAL